MTPPNPTAPDADPIAVARAELARLKRSPVARLLGPPRLNEDWAEDLPAERDPGVTPEDDE